ncbi:MAG: UDP-N-acetylmuramate--L-alanine ligase [Myxococcota bacterium]
MKFGLRSLETALKSGVEPPHYKAPSSWRTPKPLARRPPQNVLASKSKPPQWVHFVGIGGCGMSSLAEALLSRGVAVQGSDLRLSERARRLREQGAVVHQGHCADHVTGAGLVVVSSAIPADNVEVRAARESNIPVVTRGKMLADFVHDRRVVAVTGSHGKSTTTGLIGAVLRHAGLNPLVILGGALKGFAAHPSVDTDMTGGGPQDLVICRDAINRVSTTVEDDQNETGRRGGPHEGSKNFAGEERAATPPPAQNALASKGAQPSTQWGVVEADESDGSFLHLGPEVVVLTHVDREHVDYWHGGVRHLQQALVDFVNRLPKHGVLIGCWDVPAVREVMEQTRCRRISYGLGEGADYRATHVEQSGLRTSFVVHAPPLCHPEHLFCHPERSLSLSFPRKRESTWTPASAGVTKEAQHGEVLFSPQSCSLRSHTLRGPLPRQARQDDRKGTQSPRVHVRLAGRHNVCNALAAIAVADIAGVPFDRVRKALAEFPGVARRLSVMGEANEVTVIDDYAHHPTEVRATLQAVRGAFPEQRVIALFQPHRHSRTKALLHDFAACFDDADIVLITDTDGAGETPQGVSAADMAAALQRQGHPHARYVGDMRALQRQALELARAHDVLLTLGAGYSVSLLAKALRDAQLIGQKQKCSVTVEKDA